MKSLMSLLRQGNARKDRERLKSVIALLTIVLGIAVMIPDTYHSLTGGYMAMAIMEASVILFFGALYVLFPKYISLLFLSRGIVFVLSALILLSLVVPGEHPYFALFWLATLPIFIFFFFGAKEGKQWSLTVMAVLVGLIAASSLGKTLYSTAFMVQLLIGYAAVSLLLFVMEKERQGYENAIEVALKDKEVLLKEVHHRTKNNMQIMIGLLDTQVFRTEDTRYRHMFRAYVDRLKAMAAVHEHLYKEERFDKVEIGAYLKEIVRNFQRMTRHRIHADIESVWLTMKTAINLGLVFNEALSNAIEHAFEGDCTGRIDVVFRKEGNRCFLQIKDNGNGFDIGKAKKKNTTGLQLMYDIGASLHEKPIRINTENGTSVTVLCRLEEVSK